MLKAINRNDEKELRQYLDGRSQEIDSSILVKVSEIIQNVRKNGDQACR